MSINEDTWKWLKAAPIPALILALSAWVYALDDKADRALLQAAIANTNKTDVQHRIEVLDGKIDKLTEAVAQLTAQLSVANLRVDQKLSSHVKKVNQ